MNVVAKNGNAVSINSERRIMGIEYTISVVSQSRDPKGIIHYFSSLRIRERNEFSTGNQRKFPSKVGFPR